MKHAVFFIFFLSFILAGCTTAENTDKMPTLTVVTHDSFSVSEGVISKFEKDNNARVVFLKSGDAGVALNKVILTKGNPLGDVFFGVDNTFLSRALAEGIFEPYASPNISSIPDLFRLDGTNQATPVDFGDVCINYDVAWFQTKNLKVPETLEDLTNPIYKNKLVVENPATSSPGLAFLLATIAHFGEDGYLIYWQSLKDNGLVIASDWNSAYYSNFSASSGKGSQPMVVSYASSPAAEVIFADPPRKDAPTASITGKDTCFRQIEFAGILKVTQKKALAQKFIDFLLSKSFQEDIPLQMFMYPVDPAAALPVEFTAFAQTAEQPAIMDPKMIADNRERWIRDWTEKILK
jgi:thiamine transport system substrate-binding protein